MVSPTQSAQHLMVPGPPLVLVSIKVLPLQEHQVGLVVVCQVTLSTYMASHTNDQ